MDSDEEDLPPQLVDVDSLKVESIEEATSVKVPITIVTGQCSISLSFIHLLT
jgi:hypothetical protein